MPPAVASAIRRAPLRCVTLGWGVALTVLTLAVPAVAGNKANGRYDVSLAGIEVGKAALVVDVEPAGYTAAASGRVSGIAQIVTEGTGTAAGRGTLVRARPQPSSFSVTATGDGKTGEVQFAVDKTGLVKDIVVTPPPKLRADRVPLTDDHRKGILDPMSAMVMPVNGSGPLLGPDACARTLPIFDGLARYDLTFAFERVESVKAKGFEGEAVVCRVAYKAIAGHRAGRKDVVYMEKNRDIFVWLVPIPSSRVLVPFRIQVATKLGTLLISARVFSVGDEPAGAAQAGASRGGMAR